jgi:hypothetical protein
MKLSSTAGMNNRRRKLNEDQVRQIRKEYDSGLRGQARAAEFGIAPATYNQIGRRVKWRSVK